MDLERTVLVGREAATQVPLLTVAASWAFRQPLGFFWTIPGTIIVGPALHSLTWPEVIGAYVLTALLVLGIGLTGMVDRVMSLLPMRVVMAMVAGVFLSFGIDLVAAVESDVMIAAPMVLVFLLATAFPSVGRFVPPILGALVVGVLVVLATGALDGGTASGPWLAAPVFTAPLFPGRRRSSSSYPWPSRSWSCRTDRGWRCSARSATARR